MLHNVSGTPPDVMNALVNEAERRNSYEYRELAEEPEIELERDPEETDVTTSEHEQTHSDHVQESSAAEHRDEEDFGEGDTIQAPDAWKHRSRSKRKKYARTGRRRSFVVMEGLPDPLYPPRPRSKSVCGPNILPKISETDQSSKDSDRDEEKAKGEQQEVKKEKFNCLVAKSALIIPFSFGSHRTPPGVLQQRLLDRQIIGPSGEMVNLWQLNDTYPMEVAELSRQFHQMIGWREKKAAKNAWRCRRFRLTKEAYNILFTNPKLWAVQREDGKDRDIYREVVIDNVDLDLFPLGTGIIIFHVNWLAPTTSEMPPDSGGEGSATEEDEEDMRARYRRFHETASQAGGDTERIAPLSLEELRTWLYVAKFRHSIPHVAKGWTFGSAIDRNPCVAHVDSLGRRMHRAIYESKAISLNSIGNWLLMINGENPSTPPSRVAYGGHAYHHSIVVLDKEPCANTLQEYLFHLRHAYGQKNRPPPMKEHDLNLGGSYSLDRVLIPRLNRYIGISREGIVCMTWSTEYAGTSLDVSTWHKKFQGIYLILSLHAHGERTVLEELSTLAASYADSMELDLEKASLQEIEVSRRQMKELATLVARFTISMSSDECGGQSEYSEFFSTIRQTFGIPHQRAELREELQDTFSLLESGFLEERRRIKMEEQREERAEKERAKKTMLAKEAGKHRYETIISTISSVTIPAVLISSIFGMNVNVPDMEFWVVILIMVGLSIFTLIVQLAYLRTIERHHQHDAH